MLDNFNSHWNIQSTIGEYVKENCNYKFLERQ